MDLICGPTVARMALLSLRKILKPWAAALEDPMNRLPTEHIDNSNSDFSVDGRNVGTCTTGKIGLKRVMYI